MPGSVAGWEHPSSSRCRPGAMAFISRQKYPTDLGLAWAEVLSTAGCGSRGFAPAEQDRAGGALKAFQLFQSPWVAEKPCSLGMGIHLLFERHLCTAQRHEMQDEASWRDPSFWVCFARGPPPPPTTAQELKRRKPCCCRRPGNAARLGDKSGSMVSVVFAVTSSAFNSFIIYYMAAYLLFL